MDITLTQKDADFILTYLRTDLQKLNDCCDTVHGNLRKVREIREHDKELENDIFADFLVKKMNEQIDEFDTLYKKKTDILVKCIELLTIGSTDA